MTINDAQEANRITVKELRIALCPHFGCSYLKKIKPLKFSILGLHKYPKCSKHGLPLVFIDEFLGNFINAVNACLYDKGGLPPEKLTSVIRIVSPDDLKSFINGWMHCNPIGRGSQLVSQYLDGLSKAYMKLLSRKQKKSLQNKPNNKNNRYKMLRKGLNNISIEYANFLKELRTKSNIFYDLKELRSLSDTTHEFLKAWLKDQLVDIKNPKFVVTEEPLKSNESLLLVKQHYDMILQSGTCLTLMGKHPKIVNKIIPAFELFSAYYEFMGLGLCTETTNIDIQRIFENQQESSNLFKANHLNHKQNDMVSPKMFGLDIKNREKNYTAKNFMDEIMEELNNYPKEMYVLNPGRVKREHTGCTLKDISKIWGHYDGYVSEKLRYNEGNPNFIISRKNLKELKTNLKDRFGNKANCCYGLIDSHSSGYISFNTLIKNLQIEIGKFSKNVKTTLEDLALIFGYGYGMMSYIRQHDEYILSKERINLIKSNIKLLIGSNSNKIMKICEKYVKKNPDLPDYANQKYTITNPNLFHNIYENNEIMYWLGWLCSDGWVSQAGNTHYQIQLKLKREDRIIVERFANAIGYDQERIFDERYLVENDNGEIRPTYSSRVIFGCKPMWYDLKNLGIFDFKNSGKAPRIIKQLINMAKRKNPKSQLISSKEGQLALNFLIGFYDGDGNYRGGMSARILNSKKTFLEEIVDLFEIPNKVNINAEKYIDKETNKVIWKTKYQLHLGTDLFNQMLLSYEKSLERKRPENYK
ncbi:hypothetical protein LCGC14_0784990 [marine sediment metagenome]|uniref:DOD-type homing endonuclease domain-containing protein n=1 Tax=marine sediment metagenome TaxID=412755 RepID=A0A0F9PYM6_9ZZZZ